MMPLERTRWRPSDALRWPGRFDALVWIVVMGTWLAAAPVCLAQEPGGGPRLSEPSLSIEQLQARVEELAESRDIEEKVREQATQLYKQAIKQLQLAGERAELAAELIKQREGAAPRAARLQQELEEPARSTPVDIPADATPAEIEQAVAHQRQRLADAEKALQDAKQEAVRRVARRTEVPRLTQQAQEQLAEVEAALAAPPPPAQAMPISQAQSALHRATRQATNARLEALEAELPTYDATGRVLQLEQSLAEQQVEQLRSNLNQWEQAAADRRKQEARLQAERARRMAAEVHPALGALAETNLSLAQLRIGPEGKPAEGLNARIARATSQVQAADQELQELGEIQSDLQEKLAIEGISSYLGPLLLEQRSMLPSTTDLRREIAARQDEVALVRFRLTDVRQRLRALENLDDEIRALTAKLGPSISEAKEKEIVDAGRELLEQQRALLADLRDDYSTYFNRLNNLNARQQELVATTRALEESLHAHLLWTRTASNLGPDDVQPGLAAARWLVDPAHWYQVWLDVRASVRHNPQQLTLPLVLLMLLVLRRPLDRRLRLLGEQVGRDALAPYRYTLWALVVSLLRSLLWPAAFAIVGWWLYSDLLAAHFTRAVGAGLLIIGAALAPVLFLQQMLRKGGLAEAHFHSQSSAVRRIRAHLRGAILLGTPLVLVVGMLEWDGKPEWQNSLSRLLFAAGTIAAGLIVDRMFRMPAGKTSGVAPLQPTRWQQTLHVLAVAAPGALAALAVVGYYPTALELTRHVYETICLFIGITVFQGMSLRWLRLVRGRFALSRAEDEQPQLDEAAAGAEGEPPEPQIDLATVNVQTRQLLRGCVALIVTVGIWLIWVDVLPWTDWLEVPIWSAAQQVTRSLDDAGAGEAVQTITAFRVITIGHLLLAALIGLATYVAARNIPGLLQVSIPQSVPLDEGARFALISLIRYALLAVGVTICFATIGIGWSQIQWLVAALSLGIGFGLQELVANFVSGLIMLFERPVRVGDVITVDTITGTVTRIKIRATTIRSWDQQEYLVPNKELITGRVLNWTLSDKTNRITLQVGVSYSSDPDRVRRILLDIARRHRNVVADPAPLVTFENFGDSSLNFTVRVYLTAMDQRLPTMHELHTEILNRFRQEGIEIPFPQRDVNFRGSDHPIEFTRVEAEPRPPAGDGSHDRTKK